MSKQLIIGLTGSIGMGKSTVAAMFKAAGVPVFDADAEVRALQGPQGELVSAIEAAFPGTTGPEGVRREVLGAEVFADATALGRLEKIVHPVVAALRAQFLRQNAGAPVIVLDIPLLFEKGSHEAVDAVLVVSAPPEVQRARVLARPGMTSKKFAQIHALQVPEAEKRAGADHVIDTGGPLAATEAQVLALLARLAAD